MYHFSAFLQGLIPRMDYQTPVSFPHFCPATMFCFRCESCWAVELLWYNVCQIFTRPGNFDHGAYKSGDKLEAKRDAFEQFLAAQDASYFESFQEAVSADMGEPFGHYGDEDQVADTMFDWLNSKALRNRGLYVTWLTCFVYPMRLCSQVLLSRFRMFHFTVAAFNSKQIRNLMWYLVIWAVESIKQWITSRLSNQALCGILIVFIWWQDSSFKAFWNVTSLEAITKLAASRAIIWRV